MQRVGKQRALENSISAVSLLQDHLVISAARFGHFQVFGDFSDIFGPVYSRGSKSVWSIPNAHSKSERFDSLISNGFKFEHLGPKL